MFWEPTKQERKRRRVLGVVGVAIALWSCAETDAYLGDVPSGPSLTSPDASPDADTDAGSLLMCVATECPAGLTTCPSEFGPTYKCSVDLRRDQNHCGECGHACIAMGPNQMTARCVDGACELECISPLRYVPSINDFAATKFSNCNGILDDGCEVDLLSDAQNCGACGSACPDGIACIKGQCGCPEPLEYCSEWCIDVAFNDTHCGKCNDSCLGKDAPCASMPPNTDHGCVGGKCQQLRCMTDFGDCNTDLGLLCASDGCETDLTTVDNCGGCNTKCKPDEQCLFTNFGYECVPTCEQQGLTACIDFCADTLNDPNNCGGCLLSCPDSGPHQTRACNKGVCDLSCTEGFGDCNGDPSDGCETDLRSHPQHCGACGVTCDLALGQPCVEGKCLVRPCDDGEVTR